MDDISHIDAIDRVRVLANDERLRLLRLLMREPATLTQLGEVVGHHPAWVRHHVLTLEGAGLVELVETRPTKGYVEKFYGATARAFAVDFMVLPEPGERGLLVVLGSDDRALDLLAARLRGDPAAPDVLTIAMGSLEGLIALRHGLGHVAGCHLFDPETGEFNRSSARALFPGRALVLVTLAHRRQGLIVAPGNPLGLTTVAEVAAKGARLVNRNRGAGTRVWLDHLLSEAHVDPAAVAGYEDEVTTHDAAALAVATGDADAAMGIESAARGRGLDFIPLLEERYDLVMPQEVYESELLAPLLASVRDETFKREIDALGGYSTRETGAVTALGS
jgi:putative molybdopterin biosynthesis protein